MSRADLPRLAVATGCGLLAALAARAFASSGQAAVLAGDLSRATGFPLATTALSGPWAMLMLAAAASWTVWACMEIRSFLVQLALFAGALALCVTGAWLAELGNGFFPAVPVIFCLLAAFILGQFAAGFGGSPQDQAKRGLLAGSLATDRIRAAVAEQENAANVPCLVALVDVPPGDAGFAPTLVHGLLAEGAWVRRAADGRLQVVFGLFGPPESPGDAWPMLARAAEAMASRPAAWRMASSPGMVSRGFVFDGQPALGVRGVPLSECALWLDQRVARPGEGFKWLAAVSPGDVVPGWHEDIPGARPAELRRDG